MEDRPEVGARDPPSRSNERYVRNAQPADAGGSEAQDRQPAIALEGAGKLRESLEARPQRSAEGQPRSVPGEAPALEGASRREEGRIPGCGAEKARARRASRCPEGIHDGG